MRRSPTCSSASRAPGSPTRRRPANPGQPAPASPPGAACWPIGATASTGAPQEARLNAFPQFTTPLHGIDLHYLHVQGVGRSPAAAALAWLAGLGLRVPGADPAADRPGPLRRRSGGCLHRRRAVAARLRLSFKPGQRRFGIDDIADCLADLMTEVLRLRRFAAQGGDWGASSRRASAPFTRRASIGIHVNLLTLRRDPAALVDAMRTGGGPLPRRARALAEGGDRLPVDPGHAAADPGLRADRFSPAGLAAWIVEKFRAWSDCDGDLERGSSDGLAAGQYRTLLVHRLHRCVVLALLRAHARRPGRSRRVPSTCPPATPSSPRRSCARRAALAARTYTDIRRWTAMAKGGHFAAMEQPEALAERDPRVFPAAAGPADDPGGRRGMPAR